MVLLGTSIVWAFRIKIEERKHIPNLPNNCGSFCLYFHSCAFMAVTMPFSLSPRRKTACCFLVLNWAVWDDYWMQHVTRLVQCVQNAFEPLWWTSDDLIIQLLNPGRVFAIINPSITTPLNTCCHIIYHVIQIFWTIWSTLLELQHVFSPSKVPNKNHWRHPNEAPVVPRGWWKVSPETFWYQNKCMWIKMIKCG